MGQDTGHLSIHLHDFIGLECVLTVKLELVFYASNVPIIHDLTGLGVAFRDLKQAVRGRDKLEVTQNVLQIFVVDSDDIGCN